MIFEKQWIYLDNAVGHFYRTTFEIGSGGTLHPKKSKELESSTGMCVSYIPHHHGNPSYVYTWEINPKNFCKETFSDLDFFSFSFSAAAKEAGTDNRNIVDDGKSQKLTRDDIEMLKEQGLKGQVHPLSPPTESWWPRSNPAMRKSCWRQPIKCHSIYTVWKKKRIKNNNFVAPKIQVILDKMNGTHVCCPNLFNIMYVLCI